jgi:hypothetical protein
MAPKIYAHVLVYTTMFGITSGIAIAVSKTWSKTEDEKNAELLDKYPELVRKSQDGKKNMQAFFNKVQKRQLLNIHCYYRNRFCYYFFDSQTC